MKITFNSDGSSEEPINRFLKPVQPFPAPEAQGIPPLAELIPEDWLAEFAADDPERRKALDLFAAPQPDLDFDEPESSDDPMDEPKSPSLGKAFFPLPPGPGLAELASYNDWLSSDEEVREAKRISSAADVKTLEKLTAAFIDVNSATRSILYAVDMWQAKEGISDLTLDYCECLVEECHALDRVGEGVSAICDELLAEIKASLPPDPSK